MNIKNIKVAQRTLLTLLPFVQSSFYHSSNLHTHTISIQKLLQIVQICLYMGHKVTAVK